MEIEAKCVYVWQQKKERKSINQKFFLLFFYMAFVIYPLCVWVYVEKQLWAAESVFQ